MKNTLIVHENDINVDMFDDIKMNSCGVIEKMLRTDEVSVVRNTRGKNRDKSTYLVTWQSDTEKEKAKLYEQFILALCRYSLKRKHKHSQYYRPKWILSNNEKAYAYDLFKYLELFGKEYRELRLELLKPLTGTSTGVMRNRYEYEVKE